MCIYIYVYVWDVYIYMYMYMVCMCMYIYRCMCSCGSHSLWLLHLHSCDFAMCNFGKAVRPLALASILMSLLQLYTLYVQSLTNIWALTYGGPYKWVASQEAVLDMEGLADYVDALAAADMDTWAVAN